VLVDAGTPNYQQLINDLLKAQAEGRRIEVVVLETGRDGIEQISEAMAERRDVDAVHIISHGSDGNLQLGNAKLNAYNLESYRDAIKSWQVAMIEGADLLIYGCDFAGSAQGREMVETLSALTGADVAASTDKTGAAAMDGDWELEYKLGSVETDVAFSLDVQQNWEQVLAVVEDRTTTTTTMGALVGRVIATDPDLADPLTYTIVSGNAAGAFSIHAATGQIRVANPTLLDFETGPSLILQVQVTDSGGPALSDTAFVTIQLNDLAEVAVTPPGPGPIPPPPPEPEEEVDPGGGDEGGGGTPAPEPTAQARADTGAVAASLPAWQGFDPLPVLSAKKHDKKKDQDRDDNGDDTNDDDWQEKRLQRLFNPMDSTGND
jgi:hypothetical protein